MSSLQLFTGNAASPTGSYHRVSVWATSTEEAAQKVSEKKPGSTWTLLRSRPFRWSDGKLLFSQIESSEYSAQQLAKHLHDHKVSTRVFPRSVKAGSTSVTCWVVVSRHKTEVASHAS